MMNLTLNQIKSVIFGGAVADALGVPVEFSSRVELRNAPVTDMEGYGAYPVPAGSWSDDTSMTLCTFESLCKNEIDLDDVMQNFGKWYYDDEFTPTGEMFDVGNTCSTAIDNYFKNKKSATECGLDNDRSNGNGSLMRIHPMVLYLYSKGKRFSKNELKSIYDVSALTHAHMRSKIGCGIYAFILETLLDAPIKESVEVGKIKALKLLSKEKEFDHYIRIYSDDFENLPESEIKSGGYVVHTLEAALWCLLNTSSYEECVLKAVNLGDDTDTVASVAGTLAGALYGYDAIPEKWINTLLKKDYINDMCERAYKAWSVQND